MTNVGDTYEFIVTGAGSAGCGGRAAQRVGPLAHVLLEAGGRDSNPSIRIPLDYTKTFTNPRVNWMFESEPRRNKVSVL